MLTEFLILGAIQAGIEAVEKINSRKEVYEASLDEETKQKREETRQCREENRKIQKEKLRQHYERWRENRADKREKKEYAKWQAYEEEHNSLLCCLPYEYTISFTNGSYITGSVIDSSRFSTKMIIKGISFFGKRNIDILDGNKNIIASAKENRAKYDWGGHIQETYFALSKGKKTIGRAGLKYEGFKKSAFVLPHNWVLTKGKGYFNLIARNSDGEIELAAGYGYGKDDKMIVMIKDERTCLPALLMLLIYESDGIGAFSKAYDNYTMRACERCSSG